MDSNKLLERFKGIKTELENVRMQIVKHETQVKSAEKSIQETIDAMAEQGTTPETIADEYEKLLEKVQKALTKLEGDIGKAKAKLEEVEE